jgi:hypothetical protein
VSNSLAGLDWVAGHLQKPAVVLLSLGLTDDASSHALDQVCRSCHRPVPSAQAARRNAASIPVMHACSHEQCLEHLAQAVNSLISQHGVPVVAAAGDLLA